MYDFKWNDKLDIRFPNTPFPLKSFNVSRVIEMASKSSDSLFNNKEKSLHKRREEIKKYSIITYNRFGKKTYSLPKGIDLDISA